MKNLVQKNNFYRKFKRKKKIKKQQFLVKKFLNNSNNETKNIIQKKFKKNCLTKHIFAICIISLFLLVQCSPIFSLLWLSISTLYFLYIGGCYRAIYTIWGFTLFIWYLIFTISLSEVTIFIGFEQTEVILDYLMVNRFLFENLCFQTVYLLDALSDKLGVHIYVPKILNIFRFFAEFLKGTKTGCSGKGCSGEENKSSWFFSGKTSKSQSEVDMAKCEMLAKIIEKHNPLFHGSHSTTDGTRTLFYSKTWIPFKGIYNRCIARPATALEKELFENSKKETK